jgi:hypothetical protein
MSQIKISMALSIFAGLYLLVGVQSDAFAQWSNDMAMGNATNATGSGGNATNATSPLNAKSPISTSEEDQVGRIAEGYGELDNP